MANKSRTEIRNQIYLYFPQVNQSSKLTQVNDAIDLAVEEISHRHNFRCFRATTPDSANLTEGSYYLDLASFTTMGGASGYFKDVLAMFWTRAGTEDYCSIKFMDDRKFHNTFGYVDYASRTRGKPTHYTRLADRFLFNCPADETISIRCWYQKYHAPFTADTGAGGLHLFASKDNQLAFMAIVHTALAELKKSMDTLEFPQEMMLVEQKAEYYIQRLIERDVDIQNEDISIGWAERTERRYIEDAYSWV